MVHRFWEVYYGESLALSLLMAETLASVHKVIISYVPKAAHKITRRKITGRLPFPDTSPPTVTVQKPTFLESRTGSQSLRATWLGHACYYVEFLSGLRVLFDPVFEDRCSPFTWLGPKRFTEAPCQLADIPVIDVVIISHSHYDHLSHLSILKI
jgi:N-acyl-phosphatidylethanolamine-hydrolysing phospholipase D